MTGKRTMGDWIWTAVGILGVACIGVAVWMFLGGGKTTPEDAAKQQAEAANAHYEKGKELLSAGDAENAVEEIQAAINLVSGRHPVMPVLQCDLGRALVAAGREDEAARHFTAAFTLNPTFAMPYLHLGRIYEKKGALAPAWQFLRAALALHPDPVPADLEETVSSLAKSLAPKREEELEKFRSELAANPANAEAMTVLLLTRLGDTLVAADAPPEEGIRQAILTVGGRVEDLPGLLATQEEAVEDRPKSVVDRAGLGDLLLLSGEWDRAQEVFAAALDLSESDPSARLGAALSDLMAGAKGEENQEAAAKRMQGNPAAWLALGAAKVAHGDSKAAQAALSNALRLNPSMPELYRLLSLAFTGEDNAKNREAAQRAFQRLNQ